MNRPPDLFATRMVPESFCTVVLWAPDGSRASTIIVTKEIWINIDGKGAGLGDGVRYPVFHLYDYLDPSSAHSTDAGCRVNDFKNPWTNLELCLKRAQELEEAAIESGQWVTVEQLEKTK